MASWVLIISKDYPDHWDFAKTDGFWDTRPRTRIEPGDNVFFWTAGGTFVGWAQATTSTFELNSTHARAHWHDVNSGGYNFRFELVAKSSKLLRPVSWKEMATATGITVPASNGRIEVKSVEGQRYLQSLFRPDAQTDFTYASSSTAYEPGEDLRARSQRMINIRRGQGKFRDSLIDSYDARCAVTGSPVLAVIEAAHIDRYFGDHSHHVTNGLLLRADIHTLFDFLRITVDENLLIRVDPKLTGTEYESLDGTPLRLPANHAQHPDRDALHRHRESCPWMPTSSATA